jgi:hypothetical protein
MRGPLSRGRSLEAWGRKAGNKRDPLKAYPLSGKFILSYKPDIIMETVDRVL